MLKGKDETYRLVQGPEMLITFGEMNNWQFMSEKNYQKKQRNQAGGHPAPVLHLLKHCWFSGVNTIINMCQNYLSKQSKFA